MTVAAHPACTGKAEVRFLLRPNNRNNMSEQLEKWKHQTGDWYAEVENKELDESRMKFADVLANTFDLRGKKILEVGSSTGDVSALLAVRLKTNCKLFCCDPSPRAIELGKELYPYIDFVVAAAQDMPYKDHSFDFVFTQGVCMHIPPEELQPALDEMARVAKDTIALIEYTDPRLTQESIPFYGQQNFCFFHDYENAKIPGYKLAESRPVHVSAYTQKLFVFKKA